MTCTRLSLNFRNRSASGVSPQNPHRCSSSGPSWSTSVPQTPFICPPPFRISKYVTVRTRFCLSAFLCVRESFALRERRPLTSTEAFDSGLCPAGGEASGLQPSGIDSPMLPIFSAVSVSLPPLPSPSLSFPCYPLPPSGLQRGLRPPTGLPRGPLAYAGLSPARGFRLLSLPGCLPPSGFQRGFASDRPLATIWYRSGAFFSCDLRYQSRQIY